MTTFKYVSGNSFPNILEGRSFISPSEMIRRIGNIVIYTKQIFLNYISIIPQLTPFHLTR